MPVKNKYRRDGTAVGYFIEDFARHDPEEAAIFQPPDDKHERQKTQYRFVTDVV